MKGETARPSRHNLPQQQERFDDFKGEFNTVRPHQALAMKTPSDVYAPSERPLPTTPPELDYPTHDDTVRVSRWGDLRIAGFGTFKITKALAGFNVGLSSSM